LICFESEGSTFSINRHNSGIEGTFLEQGRHFVIYGIYGTIKFNSEYLVVITQRTQITNHIYKVKSYEIIKINNGISDEDSIFLEMLKKTLDLDLFYSLSQVITKQSKRNHFLPLYQQQDQRFFYNKKFSEKLIHSNLNRFILPIICGFVKEFSTSTFTYTLISRRSTENIGTRYHSRGINNNASVSNFIETEQILKVATKTYSFMQIRGSIPIFWSQTPGNLF
jgi:hypothetical protein